MYKIAVIAAMEEELTFLRTKSSEVKRKSIGKTIIQEVDYEGTPLLLIECGIGKANAAAATAILLENYTPQIILNIGSAGAFREDFAIGDVVVATESVYSDVDATCFGYDYGQVPQMPAKYFADEKWLELIKTVTHAANYPFAVHFGQIVTADSFMSDLATVEQLKKRLPNALVSDMEGTPIFQVAQYYGVPVLAMRSVSDIAGHDAAESFDLNIDQAGENAARFFLSVLSALLK